MKYVSVKLKCPACGELMGGTFDLNIAGARNPKAGDPAICMLCGEFSVFDDHSQLRIPTALEMEQFAKKPVWSIMLANQILIRWQIHHNN